MSRISEIRERTERATEGPWEYDADWRDATYSMEWVSNVEQELRSQQDNDGQFIAHSREDIPYLLSLVDRMAGALKDVISVSDRKTDIYDKAKEILKEVER